MESIKLIIIFLVIAFSSSLEARTVDSKNFRCLTEALYHEARGEPVNGILAVAHVILNRVKSKRYPDTVCKVVRQQLVKGVWQFSYLGHIDLLSRPIDQKAMKKVEKVARYAIRMYKSGVDSVKGSMYYHTSEVNPRWSRSNKLKYVGTFGLHKFYRRIK